MNMTHYKLMLLMILNLAVNYCFSANHNFISNEVLDSLLINDGPYIFIDSDTVGSSLSLREGKVIKETIKLNRTSFPVELSEFQGVEKIAALSDIHGQLEVLQEILMANHIIDKNGQWSFGMGHFVITGDIFDRGSRVTETLWFVYNLEKQAEKVGGKVHFLLGNHEYMVLHNDLRYIHEKYEYISRVLGMGYPELFGKNTLLGKWLRTKSTIIRINDILFVHGGLSNDFLKMKLTLDEVNNRYRESIELSREEIKSSATYEGLYSSSSPIWYRGYFGRKDKMSEVDLKTILETYDCNRIVVGHTSQRRIKSDYQGKLFVVDSSIKNGKTGEILLIENKRFFRCNITGKRKEF